MIRVGLGMPAVWRLRLRFELLARQAARALAHTAADPVRVTHSAAALSEFAARYERLVDLLCWSAHEGICPEKTARYAELRGWMLANYPRIRPLLAHHLEQASSDGTLAAPGEDPSLDAFESLFAPADLATLIHSDTVIIRIARTRAALDRCLDAHSRN